jgi:hypothetical protein
MIKNKIPQHTGNNRWFPCHRENIFGKVLFSSFKMAMGKYCGRGLDLKKKIGIEKSSYVDKSNNKFETCPMTICR